MMSSKISHFSVLLTITTFVKSSNGIIMPIVNSSNGIIMPIVNCIGGAYAAIIDCGDQFETDAYSYGGIHCCHVARFRHCLSSLEEDCGSGVRRFLTKVVGKALHGGNCSGGQGYKETDFPSVECVYFYNKSWVVFFLMLVTFLVVYGLWYFNKHYKINMSVLRKKLPF
jgi:hypothetical protein